MRRLRPLLLLPLLALLPGCAAVVLSPAGDIAAQQRDLQALRNLVSNLTLNPDWHARGTSLLNRIQQREVQTALNAQRLAALAQLTGIR